MPLRPPAVCGAPGAARGGSEERGACSIAASCRLGAASNFLSALCTCAVVVFFFFSPFLKENPPCSSVVWCLQARVCIGSFVGKGLPLRAWRTLWLFRAQLCSVMLTMELFNSVVSVSIRTRAVGAGELPRIQQCVVSPIRRAFTFSFPRVLYYIVFRAVLLQFLRRVAAVESGEKGCWVVAQAWERVNGSSATCSAEL